MATHRLLFISLNSSGGRSVRASVVVVNETRPVMHQQEDLNANEAYRIGIVVISVDPACAGLLVPPMHD